MCQSISVCGRCVNVRFNKSFILIFIFLGKREIVILLVSSVDSRVLSVSQSSRSINMIQKHLHWKSIHFGSSCCQKNKSFNFKFVAC